MRKIMLLFLKRLYSKFLYVTELFFLNKDETQFSYFANFKWSPHENSARSGELLIETMKYHPYIFQIAYQSNFLAEKYQLKIKTVIHSYYGRGKWLNKYLNQHLSITKLFKSFGASTGLDYFSLNSEEASVCQDLALEVFNNIKDKSDILALNIEGVKVGDLIYDTYLRQYTLATVDVDDPRLLSTIESAFVIFTSCKKYLDANNVRLVVMLHAVYIQHAILVRLTILRNIPVFLYAHREGRLLQRLSKFHFYQSLNHHKYKDIFNGLSNKNEALKVAEKILYERFSGGIDTGISYMKKSSYKNYQKNRHQVFKKSERVRVVVFLHCFFDSPHIYKNMLFEDFYEWLDFTLRVVSDANCDCYVKPHPNGLDGNDKIVNHFAEKYKNITFVDKDLSNRQLIDEGFSFGVTLYGTIAHELAYHEIPVLAAGDNPHARYSFCHTAVSISEYEKNLRKPKLISSKISKSEVEQFFYMHYQYQPDLYKNSLGNWEGLLQQVRSENNDSKILSSLTKEAEKGSFNAVDSYFEEVMVHLNAVN